MGEVFRAERADELFTQVVAVKLTRSTISHSESRRRFRNARSSPPSTTNTSSASSTAGRWPPGRRSSRALRCVSGSARRL
jgi:hypothetical protein